MFAERFGADTLTTLKTEREAASENRKKDTTTAQPTEDKATVVEEAPGQFGQGICLHGS